MKKVFIIIALFITTIFLASCGNNTTKAPDITRTPGATTTVVPTTQVITTKNPVTTVTTKEVITTTVDNAFVVSKEYDLLDLNDEYTLTHDKLTGYYFGTDFHSGNDTLLYVDFDEFLEAMDGFLVYEEYKFIKEDDKYSVYITYEDEDTHETQDCYLIFDLENDTITMDLFFIYNTKEMEETDYSYGLNIIEEKSYENDDIRATYSLQKYGIDFFMYEGKYMVPYWVANLFLCTFDYCNVFFNEDEFIFVYTDLTSLESADYNSVKECSMNTKAPTSAQRQDLMNQLYFIFENIFGVREDENGGEGFDSLKKYLNSTTRLMLTNSDTKKMNDGYMYMCYRDIEDFHTYAVHPSFYSDKKVEFELTGSYVNKKFMDNNQLYWTLHDAREEALSGTLNKSNVRFYEDTAIITLDGFNTAEMKDLFDDEGKVKTTAKDKDSFFLIRDCLKEIAKHDNIQNIILDTSLNGGGNIGAMIRVLGYFINDIYIEDYYKGFNHKTSYCYNVDLTVEGKLDEVKTDYNWYCLSSGYSYSAANTFAIICKESGIKVIGQHTGGGMCSILPLCLLDGASIYTSGYSCTTYYSGRAEDTYEFVDVQNGIDVDITIPYSDFYNDQALYNAIHQTND